MDLDRNNRPPFRFWIFLVNAVRSRHQLVTRHLLSLESRVVIKVMKRAAKISESPSGKKRREGPAAKRGGSRGARLVAFVKDTGTGAPEAPSPSRRIPAKSRAATSGAAGATRASRSATSTRNAADGQSVSSSAAGRQKSGSIGTRASPRSSRGGASSGEVTSCVVPKKRRLSPGGARSARGEVGVVKGDGVIEGTKNSSGTLGHEAEILATLLSPAQHIMPAQETTEVISNAVTGAETSYPPCALEEMFEAVEQALPMFRRRRQATLFKQVKGVVEGMCHRSFTRQHLAQIVFVQPDAYKLSVRAESRLTRGGYILRDLLLEIGSTSEGDAASQTSIKSSGNSKESRPALDAREHTPMGRGSGSGRRILSDGGGSRNGASFISGGGGSAAIRRREVFRQLLSETRARHCTCAGSAAGSSSDRRGSTRECLCLPQAPLPDTSPLPADGQTEDQATVSARVAANGLSPSVRGLSALHHSWEGAGEDEDEHHAPKDVEDLRQRLRAKDERMKLEENKSEEEKEADRRRKGNLPALADAVRSFFAHARRTTCALDTVVDALAGSARLSLSSKEAKERLRMLADVVPEWCSIVSPPFTAAPTAAGVGRGGVGLSGKTGVGTAASTRRSSGDGVRPTRRKEVVTVNTRIRFGEVRQMVVFMAGGGDSHGGGRV